MAEQRREPEYGAYPREQQQPAYPYPQQQPAYPYPQQQAYPYPQQQQAYPYPQQQQPAYPYPQQVFAQTPYGRPVRARSSAEFAALMTASVLTAVVGVYTGFLAFIIFLGLGMAPSSSFEPGERARQEVMSLFLCPGPFVALGFAWGGYAVLRRLKHPSAARWWFGVVLLIWFMVFLLWLGPELPFPKTDSE